jgi:pimeloyl-ACP methyl ester carboxylesterase
VHELSLDLFVEDLEAVVDGLGLERFPLFGLSMGAPVAVAYAAKHPERVSRLVLHGGFHRSYLAAKTADPRVLEEADVLLKSARHGWGSGSSALRQVFVAKFMGDATEAQRQAFDERQRVTSTADVAEKYLRAMFAFDVKDLAPRVSCPTIAFHSRGDQLIFFDQGRKLAALIPGARFVPLESVNHVPFREEPAWEVARRCVAPVSRRGRRDELAFARKGAHPAAVRCAARRSEGTQRQGDRGRAVAQPAHGGDARLARARCARVRESRAGRPQSGGARPPRLTSSYGTRLP